MEATRGGILRSADPPFTKQTENTMAQKPLTPTAGGASDLLTGADPAAVAEGTNQVQSTNAQPGPTKGPENTAASGTSQSLPAPAKSNMTVLVSDASIKKPVNPFGKFSVRPLDWLRALICGPTASGKTNIILSLPRPCAVLYCERPSGDVDLRDKEHEGIYLIYIDRNRPLEDGLEVLDNILTGPAKDVGFQSIALDSVSHFADWVLGDQCSKSRNERNMKVPGGATLHNYGILSAAIKPFITKLLGMPQHVLLTSHLKKENDFCDDWVDGVKVRKKLTYCYPKLTPAVADQIVPEVTLMGYSWRKEVEGQDDIFGVSFKAVTANRERVLHCAEAKSPANWGAAEEPNATAWIRRLEEEKGITMLKAAA
jgi:hypothetical protein